MSKVRLIRHEGGSKVLSVTSVIPDNWKVVELESLKTSKTSVIIRITKVS